jgi:hypothetical protein
LILDGTIIIISPYPFTLIPQWVHEVGFDRHLLKPPYWESRQRCTAPAQTAMGVWQGVAMDSLKFHLGLPCPTLLCPAGRPPLKRPARWAACSRLLPFWTPHVVRLWRRRLESRSGEDGLSLPLKEKNILQQISVNSMVRGTLIG